MLYDKRKPSLRKKLQAQYEAEKKHKHEDRKKDKKVEEIKSKK